MQFVQRPLGGGYNCEIPVFFMVFSLLFKWNSQKNKKKLELPWLQFIQWPPGSSYTFFSLIFLMMILIISCYQKLLSGTHDTFGTYKCFTVFPQKPISVQIWPVLINLRWSSISHLQLYSHISLKTNFKCSVLNGLIAAESARPARVCAPFLYLFNPLYLVIKRGPWRGLAQWRKGEGLYTCNPCQRI